MKLRRLQLDELLPMLLAFTGIIGISPFIVIRALEGAWMVVAIDSVIVVFLAVIAWSVYRYRAVRAASATMAILCITGVVLTIYARGASQVLWAYPGLVAMFYLLRPLEAVVVSLITIVGVSPALAATYSGTELAVVYASMFTTLALSGAFAAMTHGQRNRLHSLTLADPLTGVGNRRALDEAMPAAIKAAVEHQHPISLVMIDIDHFKQVNDVYGHATGDKVLIGVSEKVTAEIRATDQLFRVGGEEFVVLAVGAGLDLSQRLGESLLASIAELKFAVKNPQKSVFQVTVSVGVAELLPGENADAWYRRADDALYEAKRSGRNQVHLSDKSCSLSGTASYATG